MTTTVTASVDDAATRDRVRPRFPAFTILVVVVLIPLVVSLVSVLGRHWHPSSDDALEVLRIHDVGGRHTPLTGVQSRYGFDHPGPLLFWVLAPFRWVAGDTGVLIGVITLNAAVCVGALVVARRRGGLALAAIVGVALLVLERALGMTLLADPWNPWVSVLPFFVYVLLAWSLAERDLACLPWLAGVGSFLIQTHVGYAPLVLGLAALATLLMFFPRRLWGPLTGPHRRLVVTAGVVVVSVWAAPVIQQLTGHPGNLGEIVDYFRHPTEKTLGIAVGFGIMGRELRFPGPWIGGNDTSVLGFVFTAGTWPALVLLGITAGAGALAWLRNARNATRFVALMIGAVIIGIVAGGRITGAPGPYLVRWWWVIAALLWCALAYAVYRAVDRSHVALGAIAATAVVALAVAAASDATPVEMPEQPFSVAIAKLAPATARVLPKDRTYHFTWIDTRDLGGPVGTGMYLALAERGYAVKVDAQFAHPFGAWRVVHRPTDGTITVVGFDDLAQGWSPPPGSEEVARYDALHADARQRADDLASTIRAQLRDPRAWHENAPDSAWGRGALIAAGANPADVDALAHLRRTGIGYVVFVSPS